MPEVTSPIPQKRPEDPEEVAQELTLAANAWQAGDQAEALAALRRAASVAYRLHAGRRVSELAKAVSELSKTIMGGTASSPGQKAAAPVGKAPPAIPKAPELPTDTDADDIPISLEDVEEVHSDPFPSKAPPAALMPQPTSIASPGAKKMPALGTKKEAPSVAVPAVPVVVAPPAPGVPSAVQRASSRPGKGRRSNPPKSKESEKSGSLVITGVAAAGETSGVLDVVPSSQRESARISIKDAPPAETATNGANAGPPSEPNGDRLTSSGDLAMNAALQHHPTPVGEDSQVNTPQPSAASAPPPTTSFGEAPTPNPGSAKNVASKTQLPIDPPTVADLANIATLASLDAAARAKLVAVAKAIAITKGERVTAPSGVVVVRGEVDVRPKERGISIDRIPAGEARTLEGTPPASPGELVLIGGDAGARVLTFPKGALDFLRESAPDVYAALEQRADEMCAFASVLRERPVGGLADALLLELRKRTEVRRLEQGTVIVRASEAVRALVVVASGALTLHADETGPEVGRIRPGEVLFPRELVGGTFSPREVRVAEGGAVLLAARRGPTVTLLGENVHLRKALETWGADDPFQEW